MNIGFLNANYLQFSLTERKQAKQKKKKEREKKKKDKKNSQSEPAKNFTCGLQENKSPTPSYSSWGVKALNWVAPSRTGQTSLGV